jgi:ribose transport system substrate-binding protein
MLASGKCDVLIVSPNTTAALTPAVEEACKQVPVIIFDRGVLTDCPVTVVKPIGGYAFGIAAADYIAANVPKGGKVLALRILPGVDVLENRWAAAKRIFDEKGIQVVGVEFTDGDRAKTKSIVEDYLTRTGKLDAVWMDAGATSVAAIEAFEDQGMAVPIVTGEDQQDFLQKWKQSGMKAVAPTYPTYQWRTAVIAALRVLKGEPVPGSAWSLPQPTITAENLDKYVNEKMPPLHYAMCGCEGMPDYPQRWTGK